MKQEIEVNEYFINWISEVVVDMIKNTMIKVPEKVPILLAINEMLYKTKYNTNEDINGYLGDIVLDKIFDEIKNSI